MHYPRRHFANTMHALKRYYTETMRREFLATIHHSKISCPGKMHALRKDYIEALHALSRDHIEVSMPQPECTYRSDACPKY